MAATRSFAGGALQATLSADMTNSQTTASLTASPASLGWTETYGVNAGQPLGTSGPFVVVFDAGQASEEKCLVTAISGSTLTGLTRGYDGTAGVAHTAANAYALYPVGCAQDFKEANDAAVAFTGFSISHLVPIGKSANYNANPGDFVEMTGSHTIQLPAPVAGTMVGAYSISNAGCTISSTTNGGHIIGLGIPASAQTLGVNNPILLLADGTSWFVVAGLGDSEWTAPTITGTGITTDDIASTPVRFRVQGNIVRLQGGITIAGSYTTGGTLFTLPSYARPAVTVEVAVQQIGGGAAYLQITTAGVCSLIAWTSATNTVSFDSVTFTVD